MQTKQFLHLAGLALAVLLVLCVSSGGADDSTLVGTWDHTVQFPEEACTAPCLCPTGTPNVPIQELRQYQRHGALLAIGFAARSPGVGSWNRVGRDRFAFRFKYFRFTFTPTPTRVGSVEVTGEIHLTGPNTYESTATFDLFDVDGAPIAEGCPVNATATRFAE
jgi:hypothetical protein